MHIARLHDDELAAGCNTLTHFFNLERVREMRRATLDPIVRRPLSNIGGWAAIGLAVWRAESQAGGMLPPSRTACPVKSPRNH